MMKVKLTDKNAILPKRANPLDAGLDLYSPISITIEPHEHEMIDLGFAMELPCSMAGFIFARSGMGSFYGIIPRNCVGVIDSQYRGNVGVMVENTSNKAYTIHAGDRIAQMVVMPISLCEVYEVEELDESDRGKGGFGSTGK